MQRYWHLCVVIAAVSFLLYLYINTQNRLLTLRRTLPVLAEEVRALQEENLQLAYAVAIAQSPQRLWKLAERPEYGHLHFPVRTALFYVVEESTD